MAAASGSGTPCRPARCRRRPRAPRRTRGLAVAVKRAGDELQNGRLAAAGRSDQGDEFAMADAQGGFRQRRDLIFGAAKRHPDLFEVDHIPGRQRERASDIDASLFAGGDRGHGGVGISAALAPASVGWHGPSGRVPRACSFSTRFFITKRPRTMVWIGSAVALPALPGRNFRARLDQASSMVQRRLMSTMAMSASEPTVSVPLRG